MTNLTTTPPPEINEDDLYSVLGVEATASAEEIRRAYQEAAKRYHPDKDTGDEELFKKIKLAYETLIDPGRREIYDGTGLFEWADAETIADARAMVESLVANILNQDDLELEFLDIVFHVTDQLKKNIQICKEGIKLLEKRLKRIKKNKKKAKSDLILGVFNKKVDNLTSQLKTGKADLALNELSLKIADTCRYDFDTKPEAPSPYDPDAFAEHLRRQYGPFDLR